jgi:hypothetical protein
MSTSSSFDDSDWISQGKIYADMLPHAAVEKFTIPLTIKEHILLSPNISIHQFIDFMLPNATVTPHTVPLSDFFPQYV